MRRMNGKQISVVEGEQQRIFVNDSWAKSFSSARSNRRLVSSGSDFYGLAFTYRHAERTLTDAEVNAAHEKVVEQFKQTLQAAVRET
ncbi:MAG: hypothetical protein ABI042_10100 [Verrucomicrobiota bacterium]